MKKILVPTDFSPIADNAFRFAIELAVVLKSEILLYHVYSLDRFNYNLDFPKDEQPYARDMERKMERKRKRFNDLIIEKGVTVNTYVEEDDVFSLFNKKATQYGADLIIMGTKGATGLKAGILGSVATAAIDIATVPVLLVPPQRTYAPMKNIVLAMGNSNVKKAVVAPLHELAKNLGTEITILNVNSGNQPLAKTLAFEGVTISYREIPLTKSVNESINNFICKEGCDMLCMVRRKKSLFESLFKKSITRTQVLENQVPLLVLPDSSTVLTGLLKRIIN